MKSFVKYFFETNASEVTESKKGLHISLSKPLLEVFGKEKLDLVFDTKDLDESADLVTHGSYVLNTIYEFLQETGTKAVSRLKEKHEISRESIARQIHIQNARISHVKTKKQKVADILFNFRIGYLSDEKSEDIFTLGIDHRGHVFDARSYYTDEVIKHDLETLSNKSGIEISQKDIEVAFRTCLKEVSTRAQEHGQGLQKEILKRLHRNVTRIKGYYTAQIDEMHRSQTSYEEKRLTIEREYQHKLKEEIENHKLRIVLKLLSYHIIERTEIEVTTTVEHNKTGHKAEVPLLYDSYHGLLDYGHCPSCKLPIQNMTLLADGKIGCSRCVFVCSGCKDEFPDKEHAHHCTVCNTELCTNCNTHCHDCGHTVCETHSTVCFADKEIVCDQCVKSCSDCGRTMCSDHTFLCHATKVPICHEHRVICPKCRKIYARGFIDKQKKNDRKCPECLTTL
ncbi:hypothetical protein L6Q79_09900 [bacterium]|nr:hypothetical protein [bacterium]NUN46574.1 hypothetical protein [bacterium]